MYRIGLCVGMLFGSSQAMAYSGGNNGITYQSHVNMRCVKSGVFGIVRRLAKRAGPLEITAVCGGRHASHSYHYRGLAIDFRPLRASQRTVMALLRADPAVGGVIAEGRGLVHVDAGKRLGGRFVAWRAGFSRRVHMAARRHARMASR